MKAIVFSDSHSNLDILDKYLKKFKVDYCFGLGDYGVSSIDLDLRNVYGVRGNSYFDPSDYKLYSFYEVDGFKFMFTHGHTLGVSYGLDTLETMAHKNNIDVCFYGHTHVADITKRGNVYFINPGSITEPRSPYYPTILYLETKPNELSITIFDAECDLIYKELIINK